MRSRLNLLLVLGVASVIGYYSIVPLDAAYDAGGLNTALVKHGVAYFFLSGALLLYFHDTTKGHIEAVMTAAAFGALLEMVQFFLATRVFSIIDITVNALGASFVLLDHRSRIVTRIIAVEDQVLAQFLPERYRPNN